MASYEKRKLWNTLQKGKNYPRKSDENNSITETTTHKLVGDSWDQIVSFPNFSVPYKLTKLDYKQLNGFVIGNKNQKKVVK